MSLIERVNKLPSWYRTIDDMLTDKQKAEIKVVVASHVKTGRISIRKLAAAVKDEYKLNRGHNSIRDYISRVFSELEEAGRTTERKRESKSGRSSGKDQASRKVNR